MKEKKKIAAAIYIIFIVALLFGCTYNPFFKDTISPGESITVKGRLQLDDGSNPENTFVWLEGLDLSARADVNGDFLIELPLIPQLQPGGGLQGAYRLFFYLADYEIQYSTIAIHGGQFLYGNGDVSQEGALRTTKLLSKLINISTSIEPNEIVKEFGGTLKIEVELENLIDTVMVATFRDQNNMLAGIVFKKIDAPLSASRLFSQSTRFVYSEIDSVKIWQMDMVWESEFLEEGAYEVFPYIQIIQEGVPSELIKSIDVNADKFSYEYLKIPFKQKPAVFTVLSDGT